jgi:hypothetical protein
MRLYVDIDPSTYEAIKELVAESRYESVEQFLRVAADNQLSVERSDDSTRAGAHPDSSSSTPSGGTAPTDATESGLVDSSGPPATAYEWQYDPPASPPTREPAPANRDQTLLFSQYYRFVPLKFSFVELARVTADAGGPVLLDEFRDHMREAVVPVRDALVAWETEADVKKQNRFSTGFPKRDSKNPERSVKRYLDHYVGLFRGEAGEPGGMGHQLGFVSIRVFDEEPTIALSNAGAVFVAMRNPLLAEGPTRGRPPLSEDERNFLVAHLQRELPYEYEFVDYVYEILAQHTGTYTNHMERFRLFLDQAPGFTDDPGENRVRSHTAGTISRMVDLGILERGDRRGEYVPVRAPEAFRYPDRTATESQPETTNDATTDS